MQFEAFFGIRRSDRGNFRASEGAGTTTITATGSGGDSNPAQVFNLSAGRTCVLPSTSVKVGDRVFLENLTNFDLTVQSSNLTTLSVANSTNMNGSIRVGYVYLEALQDTPTIPAHWRVIAVQEGGSFSSNFTQTGGYSQTVTTKYRRSNNQVTLYIPDFAATTTQSSNIFTTVSIPAPLVPASNSIWIPVTIRNNAVVSVAAIELRNDGMLRVYSTIAGVGFTTGTATCGLGPNGANNIVHYITD